MPGAANSCSESPPFLITGAQLAGISAGRQPGALVTLSANGTTYEIPAVAVPYLGRGLDPSLFDVGAPRRWETAGWLPHPKCHLPA